VVTAFAEIELLSRADHFVVTWSSAFAKLAIFSSAAVNPMIVCPYKDMQEKHYEGPPLTDLDGVKSKMFTRKTLARQYFQVF